MDKCIGKALCRHPRMAHSRCPDCGIFMNNVEMNRRMMESEKREAQKADEGKPGTQYLPARALLEVSKVLEYGAKKYAPQNFRKGLDWSRLYGAALRHLFAWNESEDFDPESGLPHLAHAGCCILMLLDAVTNEYGVDDRWKTMLKAINALDEEGRVHEGAETTHNPI